MMRRIMACVPFHRSPSVRASRMLRGWGGGDARKRGLQARLRVDQEVRRGHDHLALGQPAEDLEAGLELRAELDLPRLEPAPGPVHEHDLAVAGGDHRAL